MLGYSYVICAIFVILWGFAGKRNVMPWWAWMVVGAIAWWIPYAIFTLFGEGMGIVGGLLGQTGIGIYIIVKSYKKEHKTALHVFNKLEDKASTRIYRNKRP